MNPVHGVLKIISGVELYKLNINSNPIQSQNNITIS